MKFHQGHITKLQNDGKHIFVFGSNLAGRHGKGAALCARQNWGAEYGKGVGRTGNAYAIPTKDRKLQPLPLSEIEMYVWAFHSDTLLSPALIFLVTRVGCQLAGYRDEQIAPFFADAGSNVLLPPEWKSILEPDTPDISIIQRLS